MTDKVRRPAVAGSFYPGTPGTLSRDLEKYFSRVPEQSIPGKLLGLISPHAGYMYSGGVAAYAYKQLKGSGTKNVVVLAPSHRCRFRGASLYDRGPYQTPLGEIPVNHELAKAIRFHTDLVGFYEEAHLQEHSLEVQLPFLQHALENFFLIPILLGHSNDLEKCVAIAEAIAKAVKGENAVLVASSDLSHFHSYRKAVALDNIVADYVKAYDPEGLFRALTRNECEACGSGAIIITMLATRLLGADRADMLHYANSGDVIADRSSVVGYMAAALYNTRKKAAE